MLAWYINQAIIVKGDAGKAFQAIRSMTAQKSKRDRKEAIWKAYNEELLLRVAGLAVGALSGRSGVGVVCRGRFASTGKPVSAGDRFDQGEGEPPGLT